MTTPDDALRVTQEEMAVTRMKIARTSEILAVHETRCKWPPDQGDWPECDRFGGAVDSAMDDSVTALRRRDAAVALATLEPLRLRSESAVQYQFRIEMEINNARKAYEELKK